MNSHADNSFLQSQRLLEEAKRNVIFLLDATKKIDIEYKEDIESFISKLEIEGFTTSNIAEIRKMSLILDNKINTRTFSIRESKNKMKNVLKIISKKEISQTQSNLIKELSEKIDKGASEEDFYGKVAQVFSEFSKDIEYYRKSSKQIVGEEHNHFKDGTQDILAADIGRAAKTISRDVMRMAIQLKENYPEDSLIANMHKETTDIFNSKNTQFFAITDMLSRLSTRATQLQKQEKLKSQEYLNNINGKLHSVFKTLQTSNASFSESEDLTNDFNSKIKTDLNNFKNSTKDINNMKQLQSIVSENINSLESQIEEYTSKQKNIQRKQKRQIDNLEQDVKQAMDQQQKLEKSLNAEKEAGGIDELTKVPNRKSYFEYINKAHEIWVKQQTPLSMILIDIDKFKNINDTFGHNIGDAALKNVATLINNIVGEKFFFGRIGGEEFIMICPLLNKSKASLLAERLREKLAGTKFRVGSKLSAKDIKITCSFGVAEFGDSLNEPLIEIVEVFEAADKALYQAKSEGRNSVCVVAGGRIINRTKQICNK